MTPLIKHVLVTTAMLAVGSADAFGIFSDETGVDGAYPVQAHEAVPHYPDGDHHDHDAITASGHTHAKGTAHPPSALSDAKPKEGKP